MQAFTGATVLHRITIPVRLHAALTVAATLVAVAAIPVLRAVLTRPFAANPLVVATLKAAAAVLCPIF